jgi:hypothetical protein
LDADADGLVIWGLWASGFGRALDLRPWAWSSYNELPEDGSREGLSFRLLNTLAIAADEPGGGGLHEDLEQILREKAAPSSGLASRS